MATLCGFRKHIALFAFSAILVGFASVETKADMSGSLAYSGGLAAGGAWASPGTVLTYNVGMVDGHYLYQYTLAVGDGAPEAVEAEEVKAAISHLIFETSLDAKIFNFEAFADPAHTIGVTGTLVKPDNYTESNGNPGLGSESIYGIKFDSPKPETNYLEFSFESNHQPMWGDFYAKDGKTDGQDNYLHNVGLGDLGDPLTDPARYDYDNDDLRARHILVPDTIVVPVPGAVLLGAVGLSVAGGILRRKSKNA